MNERKSLIQAVYSVCMAYKSMEIEVQPFAQIVESAAISELDDAIDELCKTLGLNRHFLESNCY